MSAAASILIDQIQGYYFSPPLPVPAIERILLARTGLRRAGRREVITADAIAMGG